MKESYLDTYDVNIVKNLKATNNGKDLLIIDIQHKYFAGASAATIIFIKKH